MRCGPVSAATMQARAVPDPRAFVSEHYPAEEYDAFLAGWPILLSSDFARALADGVISLGLHHLRGLATPHELFAPA